MNTKQAFLTAAMVVGLMALMNQFDQTKTLMNGGNRFFS